MPQADTAMRPFDITINGRFHQRNNDGRQEGVKCFVLGHGESPHGRALLAYRYQTPEIAACLLSELTGSAGCPWIGTC